MGSRKKKLFWLVGMAVFAVSFTVYMLTLCPSVYVGDSAELITAASNAGIAHPPGYPMYVLFGKLFTFIPAGSIAFRVNLMSAFFSALTVMLVFFIMMKVTGKTVVEGLESFIPAVSASLALAFSSLFWSMAVVAEVFALNTFFLALLVLLYIKYSDEGRLHYLYLFAFVYGLGLTNHQTLLFALPAFMWGIWIRSRKLNYGVATITLKPAMFFVFGLSFYLYLLVRSRSGAIVNWDMPDTIGRFLRVALRAGYGTFKLTETGEGSLLSFVLFKKVWIFLKVIAEQFGLAGTLIGLTGLIHSIVKRERLHKLLLALFAFTGIGFVLIANTPVDTAGLEVMKRFYIMPVMIYSVWIGIGLKWVIELISRRSIKDYQVFGLVMFILLALLPLKTNYYKNDRSGNNLVYNYGMNILKSLERNSILFVEKWDETVFILAYLWLAEGQRKDVMIYDCHASLLENIYGRDYIYLRGKQRDVRRTEVEGPIVNGTSRPVYYVSMNDKTKSGFELLPEGIIKRVKRKGYKGTLKNYNSIYNYEGVYDDKSGFREYRVDMLLMTYPYMLMKYYLYHEDIAGAEQELARMMSLEHIGKETCFEAGTDFLRAGHIEAAKSAYKKALELEPGYAAVHSNVGVIHEKEGNYRLAVEAYLRAIELEPENAQSHYNLAVIYWKLNKWPEVVRELRKVLSIEPENRNARKFLPTAIENLEKMKE